MQRMKYLLPIICIFTFLSSQAQIDTEFWFAAPDLTMGKQGEPRRDSTIYLVFSTLNQPSEVRILQPANLDFEPIEISLGANESETVNLGLRLSQIESKLFQRLQSTGVIKRACVLLYC
jgi:hypothetical protein